MGWGWYPDLAQVFKLYWGISKWPPSFFSSTPKLLRWVYLHNHSSFEYSVLIRYKSTMLAEEERRRHENKHWNDRTCVHECWCTHNLLWQNTFVGWFYRNKASLWNMMHRKRNRLVCKNYTGYFTKLHFFKVTYLKSKPVPQNTDSNRLM